MLFESKIKEILKHEIKGFIIYACVLLLLVPYIVIYALDGYNPTKIWNLLAIFAMLIILIIIMLKKIKHIRNLRWSLRNYILQPSKVQDILKSRKSTLISYHGVISLYVLYDEALKILRSIKMEKYA